jgi:hypothetical protein
MDTIAIRNAAASARVARGEILIALMATAEVMSPSPKRRLIRAIAELETAETILDALDEGENYQTATA